MILNKLSIGKIKLSPTTSVGLNVFIKKQGGEGK